MLYLFLVVFVAIALRFRRNVAPALLALTTLLSACAVVGGSSTLPPVHIPQEQVREICWEPPNPHDDADTIDTTDTGDVGKFFVFINDKDVVYSKNRWGFAGAVREGGFIYKYVESAPIENLRLIPMSRTDTWCSRIPKPTDEAVLKLIDPCATASWTPDGRSAAKNLIGQTEGATYRSPILCNQQPQMQWTTQQTTSILSRKIAFQEAYDNAHKTAMELTRATAQMQAVINKSDSWLKRALRPVSIFPKAVFWSVFWLSSSKVPRF